MRYRVTHLWSVLAKDERSLRWLARKVGCSHAHLVQLRSGRTTTVSANLAQRIADVLRLPVNALFVAVADEPGANAAD